jgi:hypothetical protein
VNNKGELRCVGNWHTQAIVSYERGKLVGLRGTQSNALSMQMILGATHILMLTNTHTLAYTITDAAAKALAARST